MIAIVSNHAMLAVYLSISSGTNLLRSTSKEVDIKATSS